MRPGAWGSYGDGPSGRTAGPGLSPLGRTFGLGWAAQVWASGKGAWEPLQELLGAAGVEAAGARAEDRAVLPWSLGLRAGSLLSPSHRFSRLWAAKSTLLRPGQFSFRLAVG